MNAPIAITVSAAKRRGAASSFADTSEPAGAVRVCRGTSCMLAGADDVRRAIADDHHCRDVYCLGYCDRSPVVLRRDNTVAVHVDSHEIESALAATGDPGPPAIRCPGGAPVVTARIGRGDFSPLDRALSDGAYRTLSDALQHPGERVLRAVIDSSERGRGGAGFPTGIKWRTCAQTPAEHRYIIANGDEGDPGSFIDRLLMEQDPHGVIEGMLLAAHAVGADRGIVFIRSEYPRAIAVMTRAVEEARIAGFIGERFEVGVVHGKGGYVCGEETALLNTIEGGRGEVRLRPPYPAEVGLYGFPTVVNNVETLVNVPRIAREGAERYRRRGTAASPGTKAICLNHGFARPGVVEVDFGVSLRELIETHGGGGRDGRAIEAVLLGGPMGSVLLPEEWDVPVCYEAMSRRGIQLGHGGLVALPEGTDYRGLLVHWLTFMQHESCGKCVPCRLGSKQALEIARGAADERDAHRLRALLEVIGQTSLCAFGQLIPGPVSRLLERFGPRMGLGPKSPAGESCE